MVSGYVGIRGCMALGLCDTGGCVTIGDVWHGGLGIMGLWHWVVGNEMCGIIGCVALGRICGIVLYVALGVALWDVWH